MVSSPSTNHPTSSNYPKLKPTRPHSAPKKTRSRPRRNPSRKESQIRTQVINHLRKVERYSQGQPHQSVRLHIKECNQGYPQERPFAGAVLFGEEGYFWESKNGTRAPLVGYRIVVDPLGDSDSSDEDEDDAPSNKDDDSDPDTTSGSDDDDDNSGNTSNSDDNNDLYPNDRGGYFDCDSSNG
jgi:hypothetical protein